MSSNIYEALKEFCKAVKIKSEQITKGEPEDQLRAPFENFMEEFASILEWQIVCTGETALTDRLGKPDYAVHLDRLLAGYVELKAPGTGANARYFKGRNKEQFLRFSAIPNLIYTDGNEWALYRDGSLIGGVIHIEGDLLEKGRSAVTVQNAQTVEDLLRDFLQWKPIIPTDSKGKIQLQKFAEMLAPLCRMLRRDVTDSLENEKSPLVQLAQDWRELLFPDASDDEFSDAYAQTVTFALLLGRSEGADPLTISSAVNNLGSQHSLLSRALQVLTETEVRKEISAPLNLLVRVIGAVPPDVFDDHQAPWLYFYEDFLAEYDPELRKNAGAYFTPVEVVHAQVRLIDNLLAQRLEKPSGFSDPDVITLDPATGTGTYLLGVIEHAMQQVEDRQGAGAVPGQATDLGKNLYGFEMLVGPFAVSELRVSRALHDQGAALPDEGPHIYLTNTLEDPNAEPKQLPLYLKPISDQHEKALKVKDEVPVIVCLGNPPYDRHEAATADNKAQTGGWVRWGEDGQGTDAILDDFIEPAKATGHGVHIKNLYNLYVYFWRWALWKVFEQDPSNEKGVVSFISASSYLDGDAFSGMREHMRRVCNEIWIIDLGGEGRGTRQEENIFAIQTPVAIAVALRTEKPDTDKPAKVNYTQIKGSKQEKLDKLESIVDLTSLQWQDCPEEWQGPFRPVGKGSYFNWPLLTDLMPWQHSAVQLKRTWPIAPDIETLKRRWQALLSAEDRAKAFRETSDRKINKSYKVDFPRSSGSKPIAELSKDTPIPKAVRYAYRSFDRQWIIADGRLMSRRRPDLWRTYNDKQIFLISLFSQPLGKGPALTTSVSIPDLDYFRGSYGAKATLPLYRKADVSEANIVPDFLDYLGQTLNRSVSPEDCVAYVYGLLAQPAFTERFFEELKTTELRVPFTKDATLFDKVREVGSRLLWLHTYGERMIPPDEEPGRIPQGSTKCTKAIPNTPEEYPETYEYDSKTKTLHVGEGELAPVPVEVFEFEVSGLKVVQSWLDYRMKGGAGRKSSPLDDIHMQEWPSQFTTELLELLWVLEKTVAGYPEQARLLDAVVSGECFTVDEVPSPPEHMRKPPKDNGGFVDELI